MLEMPSLPLDAKERLDTLNMTGKERQNVIDQLFVEINRQLDEARKPFLKDRRGRNKEETMKLVTLIASAEILSKEYSPSHSHLRPAVSIVVANDRRIFIDDMIPLVIVETE